MPTKLKTYQGSSVGSQQTRHTLQVKHMALSSPEEAGCKIMRERMNHYLNSFFMGWQST
jgi:hypothetical protein